MFVRTISIRREDDYYGAYGKVDPTKPFLAIIEVQGVSHKTELRLSAELSARIVEIIAEEVAAAGRATAEAMTADCLTATALPAPATEGA